MKRAQEQEEKCRRTEFQCKLYGIIKDLDRSMKSECGQRANLPISQRGGLGQIKSQLSKEKKPKGSECCCPPGCCQQSMEFRMPKIIPKEEPSHKPAEEVQDPHGTGTGHLGWHNEDHAWGCRPIGEGGPGSQSGGRMVTGGPGYNPNVGGGSPNNDFGAAGPRCGGGSPGTGGGSCTYKPMPNASPNQMVSGPNNPPTSFQFPQTPEEAMHRGCFVARSA